MNEIRTPWGLISSKVSLFPIYYLIFIYGFVYILPFGKNLIGISWFDLLKKEDGPLEWLQFSQFFSSSLIFNDIAVQKYRAGSKGIGVHRDGYRYRDLILIICLSGSSEFFVANSRDGSNMDVIDDTPGRLVLMSGPGFKNLVNPDNRLFHGVKNVENGRLSIGLRCNSRFH